MDKFIDARFDRVEKALTTLIDSIAKYNPSTALAEDLLTADKELSTGLIELQKHQNNHLRILVIRDEVATLDAQIKSTLLTLATSRKDMLSTTATVFPGDDPTTNRGKKTKNYEFTYEQLMSYARRISRNTIPGPGQTEGSEIFGAYYGNGAAANADTAGANTFVETPAAFTPAAMTPAANGTGTPRPPQSDAVDTPGGAAGGALGVAVAASTGSGAAGPGTLAGPGAATITGTPTAYSAIAAPTNVPDVLPQDLRQYVAPTNGTVFLPWPQGDLMLHGGLRAMQVLADRYKDCATPPRINFISLEEQEERERQERERVAREAEEREAREARETEEHARRMAQAVAAGNSGPRPGGGSGAAPAPVQFASMLDMDDD